MDLGEVKLDYYIEKFDESLCRIYFLGLEYMDYVEETGQSFSSWFFLTRRKKPHIKILSGDDQFKLVDFSDIS